jgi:hypothetical protein
VIVEEDVEEQQQSFDIVDDAGVDDINSDEDKEGEDTEGDEEEQDEKEDPRVLSLKSR